MSPQSKASDEEIADALARLHDLAEQTREQMREVLRMTGTRSMTMSYSKLAVADEALGKLTCLERKTTK